MVTVDTHSFSPFEPGWVLDAGARGFAFAKHLANHGAKVISLEPDKYIADPKIPGVNFYNEALYSECGQKMYGSWSTGEGNLVFDHHQYKGENYDYMHKDEVWCRTIDYYMRRHNIEMFELIKLDIEGSEFPVITDYIERKQVLTKQFSIEWHYFTGQHEQDHKNFNREILKDKWWTDTYECIKNDPMDSVYVLKNY